MTGLKNVNTIVWDAHTCVPLDPVVDLNCLKEHLDIGVNYVSINIAMDMNPLADAIQLIASFRKQIQDSDFLVQGDNIAVIEQAKADNKLAVSFDIEGGNCLNEDPNMVYLMYELGVRQIHLAYNRNNKLAGGCHDDDCGLTVTGKRIVDAINDCGMFMDVSHTGYRSSMDIFNYSSKPVIYSHANAFALFEHGRNIKDEQIKACVATGGMVCVNGVARFLVMPAEDKLADAMVDHIEYMADLVGIDKLGIGLDYIYPVGKDKMPAGFDVDYWWPKSAGYGDKGLASPSMVYAPPKTLVQIYQGLSKRGYSEAEVCGVLGQNIFQLAKSVWVN